MKKATIIIQLVPESADKTNEELERDISKNLQEDISKIPWAMKIQSVKVE